MSRHGDCRILPAAMVAAVAMLAASLPPALAQREDAPEIERYDFEDLGIDLPGVISEPIDSLISVFVEEDETPTAEQEALAAEREALAAEKAALEAEKAALAAEKAALAAEEEALAAERDALAAEKEALTAAQEAPAVAEQAPEGQSGVRIEISTAEEEAPQAGEQAPPPQETDFVRDLYAAWADRDALARALQWVAAVADIDMPLDQHGNTALHYAAPARLDVLRAIVARGADCDARNGFGASPLHVAAAQRGPHGQTSGPRAVALLAQCGADPDLRDNLRVTPLHAVYASVELGPASRFLNTIVLARVPYDSRDRWRDAYEAGGHVSGGSGGKSTQVLRALLETGADPDGRDVNGATPLMMAVKTMPFTYGEHIPLLLKHEADADARDIAGRTAIMHAIFSWDSAHGDDYGVKAIAALLAGGADPDVQDEEGATALIHAVRKESFGRRDNGGALREVELLLAGGADPCIADRGGRLPWDYAQEGSLEQDLLRQAGGMPRRESFEITNFDGSTYDALGAEEGCDTEARMAEAALGLDREARERVQACLVAQGFAAGTPDGVFGARTRSALRAWQRERGEGGATGYLTQEGMAALLASCAPGPRPLCAGGEGEPACWMEVENRPGCYLWTPSPLPEETVAWSGACVEGKASGRGKTAWRWREDGAWKTFGGTGEYREGRAAADGHWLHHYSDGQTWEGPKRRGQLHGLWVRRGSGGLERACMKSGERQADERSCVHAVDRAMQTLRPAAVRSGPGEDYEKLATLPAGQRVKVTGSARGGWRQVEMEDGGSLEGQGFVRAALLEEAVVVPAVVLEPKCEGAEDGAECWQEFTEKPGCYAFDGRYNDASDRMTADHLDGVIKKDAYVSWSGQCSGGVAVGRGVLIEEGPGYDVYARNGIYAGEGEMRNGKRHGIWSYGFVCNGPGSESVGGAVCCGSNEYLEGKFLKNLESGDHYCAMLPDSVVTPLRRRGHRIYYD